MRCQESKQKIYSLIDGELCSKEERALYGHLCTCASCMGEYKLAKKADALLEEYVTHEVPESDFKEKVMKKISEEEQNYNVESQEYIDAREVKDKKPVQKRNFPWRWSGLVAGFLIAFLIAAGSFGFNGLQIGMDWGDNLTESRIFKAIGWERETDPPEEVEITGGPAEREPPYQYYEEGYQDEEVSDSPEVSSRETESEDVSTDEDRESKETQVAEAKEEEIDDTSKEDEADEPEMPSSDRPLQIAWITGNISSSAVSFDSLSGLSEPHWIDGDEIIFAAQEKDGFSWYSGNIKDGNSSELFHVDKEVEDVDYAQGMDDKVVFTAPNEDGVVCVWAADKNGRTINLSPVDEDAASLENWAFNPVVSSQGKVAFLTERFDGVNIMVAEDTKKAEPVTDTIDKIDNAVWSPEGDRIAYYKYWQNKRTGAQVGSIYVQKPDGTNVKKIAPAVESKNMEISWSPDGDYLAVNVDGADKKGLWRVSADGSEWDKMANEGGGKMVSWSPEGQNIVFNDSNGAIYVLTGASSNEQSGVLVAPHTKGLPQETAVSWAPDGTEFVFEKNSKIWLAVLPEISEAY